MLADFARIAAWIDPSGAMSTLANPLAGSDLFLDDSLTDPFGVSHMAATNWGAGVEHLHAVRAMVLDAGLLTPTAPFTLVRAAIESAAVVVWLLRPDDRTERMTRALGMWFTDYEDRRKAEPVGNRKPATEWQARIRALAVAQGLSANTVGRAVSPTQVVKHAGAGPDGTPILDAWRLASGMAHARTWARLHGTVPTGVIALSATHARVAIEVDTPRLTATLAAATALLREGEKLARERSTP